MLAKYLSKQAGIGSTFLVGKSQKHKPAFYLSCCKLPKQLPMAFYLSQVFFAFMFFARFSHKSILFKYPANYRMTAGEFMLGFKSFCAHERILLSQIYYPSFHRCRCLMRTA